MAGNVKTSPPQDLEHGWDMNYEAYAFVVEWATEKERHPITHTDGDGNHHEPPG